MNRNNTPNILINNNLCLNWNNIMCNVLLLKNKYHYYYLSGRLDFHSANNHLKGVSK